jgi:hypothetical protein
LFLLLFRKFHFLLFFLPYMHTADHPNIVGLSYPDADGWVSGFLVIPIVNRRGNVYAVSRGYSTGVFDSHSAARSAVDGYSGAVLKKFSSRKAAEKWLRQQQRIDPGSAEFPYPTTSPSFSDTDDDIPPLEGATSSDLDEASQI